VTFEPLANDMGFGDNTIVVLPTGVSYSQPTADTTYMTHSERHDRDQRAGLGHDSVTVIDPDSTIANLDAGRTPTRWTRTGSTFKAYTTPQTGTIAKSSTSAICRYYIPPGLGNSHFFGRGTAECDATGAAHPTFVLEDPQFMQMFLPVAGACQAGTIAVYRVFSNRPDANHRYMIDRAIRDQMVARGWLAEGDGSDLVVMCAPG
jgi:hypothetical protein